MALKNIRAVLFDFDGTLIDTESYYGRAFLQTIKRMGLDKTNNFKSDDDILNFYRFKLCGIRVDRQQVLLAETFPDTDILKLQDSVYHHDFVGLVESFGIPRKAGVNEIFEYLHGKGIRFAIASMSKRPKLLEFCGLSGIDLTNVECIIGGTDIINAKPHPEIYLKCMEQLGVSPDETVVVEDSTVGALSGINAGCKTVIVRDFAPLTPEICDLAYKVLEKDCLIQLKGIL
jgi:DNA helicase-2/ATP-dependent DNA helicase PcrA